MRTFDLATGKKIETIKIYNPNIARYNGVGAAASHAASFAMGQSGMILIYDGANGVSIPIIRDGKDVPAAEHTQGVPGLALGSRRIVFERETGQEELATSDGSFIRNLGFLDALDNMIALGVGSKNGDYFVRCNKFSKMDFTVSTWDGRDIGRVTWEVKERWWTDPINDLIQVGPDGAFYYVYPDNDCLYVYRWSR